MKRSEFLLGIRRFLGINLKSLEQLRKAKVNGRIWTYHINDKDKSFLHAHNYEKRQKINLETGEIIDVRTKRVVSSITQKELNNIRRKLKL